MTDAEADIRVLEGRVEVLGHELAKHESALAGRALAREFAGHMQAIRDEIAELTSLIEGQRKQAEDSQSLKAS